MRVNIDLSINDYDRNLFVTRKLVVEIKDHEGPPHIVLKVLAYAMHYAEGLVIEPRFEGRYDPDLLLRNDDHSPALWIECGQVRVAKLDKLSFRYPDAQLVVVKQTEREARELMQRCRGEVRRLSVIEFIGFNPGFCANVAGRLGGKNDWIAILSGADLQLVVEGATLETGIHRFRAV